MNHPITIKPISWAAISAQRGVLIAIPLENTKGKMKMEFQKSIDFWKPKTRTSRLQDSINCTLDRFRKNVL